MAIVAASLFWLLTPSSQANVISDGTVGTQVKTSDHLNFQVNGGTIAGPNLFHSFEELSVSPNGSVQFNPPPIVETIFSRVTGANSSQIDGQLIVAGGANLLLLNPNGIQFGTDASLQLNGSFLATTASQIDFADGLSWGTNLSTPEVAFSASHPVGLQLGINAQPIVVRPQPGEETSVVQLQLPPGQTLALIGSGLVLEGAFISVPRGQIQVYSVAPGSSVGLQTNPLQIFLNQNPTDLRDIQISNSSITTSLNVQNFNSNDANGKIQIQGQAVQLLSGSLIAPGGLVDIDAAEQLELRNSAISTPPIRNSSSSIQIQTKRLLQTENSLIDASRTISAQNAEVRIRIQASELVEVVGGGSLITAQNFSDESGRNITTIEIFTGKLTLAGGAQVTISTFGTTDSGTINILAREIEIQGQGMRSEVSSANSNESGILARTVVEPREQLQTGAAGNVNIVTGDLFLRDGGRITASADEGNGRAGNVNIQAEDILLDNGSEISASTGRGDRGNLFLRSQNLQLINSQIRTNAQGEATGGNITIESDLITGVDSTIQANAQQGVGGRVILRATSLLSKNTPITATSERGPEFNGIVDINAEPTPDPGFRSPPEQLVRSEMFDQCSGGNLSGNPSQHNSLLIIGQGGMASRPDEFRDPLAWRDPRSANVLTNSPVSPSPSQPSIVEAKHWQVNPEGQILLVAQAADYVSDRSPGSQHQCYLF